MIFDQQTAYKLLDQFLDSRTLSGQHEARALFRQEYGWASGTIKATCQLNGEWDRVNAINAIMAYNPPIKEKHQVVDCSGGDFGKIGEALGK